MNKATAASMITENVGAWPRDIQAYLALHGLACVPYKTASGFEGFQFDDCSIVHEDFEDAYADEDAVEEYEISRAEDAWEHHTAAFHAGDSYMYR